MSDDTSKNRVCQDNKFIRPLYFHGMLLDEKDFTVEQSYHIEKRKLINRTLHGWGIVCGLNILWKENETQIQIEILPGMALDCHGNEIWVSETVKVDLWEIFFPHLNKPQKPFPAENSEPGAASPKQEEIFIGIRHNEKSTTPVPTYVATSDCDKSTCHFSRTQEGFCIKFLTASKAEKYQKVSSDIKELNKRLSPSKQKTKNATEPNPGTSDNTNSSHEVLPCPEVFPEEHYVILGKIQVDRSKKKIINNDITQGRTYINPFKIFSQLMGKIENLEREIQDLKAKKE
ncbi:hypothetical protein D1BOALGB6SA_7210 [Olavius sp. associated proteobacterium Delta 1]|nr:hypothetical protein D1BOALGB6SA_7210 [Olavius sp. associated proteobacterium Delta 1]